VIVSVTVSLILDVEVKLTALECRSLLDYIAPRVVEQ